jgi:membrane protease YdiL (CAAX protease family)
MDLAGKEEIMAAIQAFIKRQPAWSYFVLTFLLSWGGVLIAVAPAGFPGSTQQIEFYTALVVMEAGPLLAGILLTALVYGRAGFRDFFSRLLRWRVAGNWYTIALLTTPLLVLATLLVLSSTSRDFLPAIFMAEDKVSVLLSGLMAGLLGGLFEEAGWTGFAVPELRRRFNVLTTGLIVGVLWGVWHFLLTIWASGDAAGALSPALLAPPLLFYIGVLPAYRVLMVWVYDRTESLLMAMLMHVSLTAFTLFILAPQAVDVLLSVYYIVLTAVMWVVVGMVAIASGGHLSREGKLPPGIGSPTLMPR